MKKIPILMLFFVLGIAFAQEGRAPIATETLFAKLIGNWQGEGWTMLGPGQRAEFSQEEIISSKANGHVVVVEGLGTDKDSGELVFQAFGIFSYDLVNDQYQFTAYQTNGYSVVVEPDISDDQFIWGFDTPQGTIRYTADITENSWSQVGEFSPDGGNTWFQTFAMDLTKVE